MVCLIDVEPERRRVTGPKPRLVPEEHAECGNSNRFVRCHPFEAADRLAQRCTDAWQIQVEDIAIERCVAHVAVHHGDLIDAETRDAPSGDRHEVGTQLDTDGARAGEEVNEDRDASGAGADVAEDVGRADACLEDGAGDRRHAARHVADELRVRRRVVLRGRHLEAQQIVDEAIAIARRAVCDRARQCLTSERHVGIIAQSLRARTSAWRPMDRSSIIRRISRRAPFDTRLASLAALIFLQVLPATLLVPAIRPLFAAFHGGSQGAMNSFMAVNMIGAIMFAPLAASLAERGHARTRLVVVFALVDAILLALIAQPFPTAVVLGLRGLEGGAHVGATSLLFAEVAARAEPGREGRAMGLAGGALMAAVALGSTLGAFALAFGPSGPFYLAAGVAVLVSVVAMVLSIGVTPARPTPRRRLALFEHRALWSPFAAVAASRFTVGCVVVTFALFAHGVHAISDRDVGLLFSVWTGSFALATYPAGRLAEHARRSLLLASGMMICAAALFSIGFLPSSLLWLAMLIAGLSSALVYASVLGYASVLSEPSSRPSAMGLLNASSCLGMVLGPTVAGITTKLLRDPADPIHAYRVVFGVAAASLVVWVLASLSWLRARSAVEAREVLSARSGA